jgi:hypothetical protein
VRARPSRDSAVLLDCSGVGQVGPAGPTRVRGKNARGRPAECRRPAPHRAVAMKARQAPEPCAQVRILPRAPLDLGRDLRIRPGHGADRRFRPSVPPNRGKSAGRAWWRQNELVPSAGATSPVGGFSAHDVVGSESCIDGSAAADSLNARRLTARRTTTTSRSATKNPVTAPQL